MPIAPRPQLSLLSFGTSVPLTLPQAQNTLASSPKLAVVLKVNENSVPVTPDLLMVANYAKE